MLLLRCENLGDIYPGGLEALLPRLAESLGARAPAHTPMQPSPSLNLRRGARQMSASHRATFSTPTSCGRATRTFAPSTRRRCAIRAQVRLPTPSPNAEPNAHLQHASTLCVWRRPVPLRGPRHVRVASPAEGAARVRRGPHMGGERPPSCLVTSLAPPSDLPSHRPRISLRPPLVPRLQLDWRVAGFWSTGPHHRRLPGHQRAAHHLAAGALPSRLGLHSHPCFFALPPPVARTSRPAQHRTFRALAVAHRRRRSRAAEGAGKRRQLVLRQQVRLVHADLRVHAPHALAVCASHRSTNFWLRVLIVAWVDGPPSKCVTPPTVIDHAPHGCLCSRRACP